MMPGPDYSQQTGIFNPATFGWDVHVIGVGGIGNQLLMLLASLGVPKIHVWDGDRVERKNLAYQPIFRPSDIGQHKVDAAAAYLVRQEAPCQLTVHREEVTAGTTLDGVVLSGVDSMRSRREIWQALQYNPLVPLYIDARMGGEKIFFIAVNPGVPEDVEQYEKWLFDGKVAQLPCAARVAVHPPAVLAGLVTTQLTLFSRGLPYTDVFAMDLRRMKVQPVGRKNQPGKVSS